MTVRSLAAIGVLAFAGACNGSPPASQRVGSDGGTVEHEGVALEIPAGALDREVDIEIETTLEGSPAGFLAQTAVYRFEPAGLEFAVPAQVRIEFAGDADASVVWSQSSGSGFEMLATERDGEVATAAVTHFSLGFVGSAEQGAADAGSDEADAGSDEADAGSDVLDGGGGGCAPDSSCPLGTVCMGGQCTVCGHIEEPCCAGHTCVEGLCAADTDICLHAP